MNEPLDPLPSEVTDLFDEERRAPGLSSAAKERLVARLAVFAPIAVPASPSGGTSSGNSSNTGHAGNMVGSGGATPAAAAAKAVITKIGVTALVLAVGGVGGAALQARYGPIATRSAPSVDAIANAVPVAGATSPPASPPSTSSTSPIAAATGTPAPVVAPRTPSPAAAAAAGAPASASAPARDDGLRRERASLEVARTGITRGDFDAALSALSRHSREFPQGQLSEERDSMTVQALVGLKRHEEARAAAEKFQRKFPGSLLQSSVDAAIATIR